MEFNNERFELNMAAVRRMGWLALFLSVSEGVHGFTDIVPASQMSIARTPDNANSILISFTPHRNSCSKCKPFRRNNFSPELQAQSVDNIDVVSSVSEQDLVDDYLEFLDRRYHRFNDNDDGAIRFSALRWLKQGKDTSEKSENAEKAEKAAKYMAVLSEGREEDALYVLGVAGLASKKLLHKHRLVPREDDRPGTPVSVEPELIEHIADAQSVESKLVSAAAPFVTLMRRMEAKHRLFLRQEMTKINAFTTFIQKNLVNLPLITAQALEKLWNVGGGRRALQYTLTACATAALILQPLLRVILCGNVSNAR